MSPKGGARLAAAKKDTPDVATLQSGVLQARDADNGIAMATNLIHQLGLDSIEHMSIIAGRVCRGER